MLKEVLFQPAGSWTTVRSNNSKHWRKNPELYTTYVHTAENCYQIDFVSIICFLKSWHKILLQSPLEGANKKLDFNDENVTIP